MLRLARHGVARRFGVLALSGLLAVGGVPAVAWGEPEEATQDVGTLAGQEELTDAQKLAALWDKFSALDVADVADVAGISTVEDEAGRALAGEPSTARGIVRAFRDEAQSVGIACEEVASDDGRVLARVVVGESEVLLDVAGGVPGERPWETTEGANAGSENELVSNEVAEGSAVNDSIASGDETEEEESPEDDELAGENTQVDPENPEAEEAYETSDDDRSTEQAEEAAATKAASVETAQRENVQVEKVATKPVEETNSDGGDVGTAKPTNATEKPTTNGKEAGAGVSAQATPSVTYAVHVQGIGDQAWRKNGKSAGTFGQSRRLESIRIKLSGVSGGIEYRTHVQGLGWESRWASGGGESGTHGQSRRLEAIQIRLTGAAKNAYDVYYRVHAQRVGWMAWAKNGAKSGTAGMSWRLEAIQVVLVPKGGKAPGKVDGVSSATRLAMLENPGVTYHTHVQTHGWMEWVGDGELSGTSGESKRLEALEAKLGSNKVPGSIRYAVHVQSYGWQDVRADGAMAGTSGESKRLEAIRVELKGEVAKYFDVWYRTHVQTYGWLGWAKNTHDSGTANLSRRMEALEIRLVPKGRPAPGSTEGAFIDRDPTLSGDAELDAMIGEFVTRTGTGYEGLRRAYEIISSYPYSQGNRWPGPDWESWSIPYAKEMYRNHTGNCYRYASLMCWTARRLGYDAKVVPGWIPGRVNPHCDHGWVEVLLDGQVYIIDAEMNGNDGYPEYNWFMIKYADAHLRYYDLNDNQLLL